MKLRLLLISFFCFATLGQIMALEVNGDDPIVSSFVMGDTLFFEGWESGTIRPMWDTNSSTENGLIGVFGGNAVFQGANGLAMGNNSNSSTNTVNQLTLNIPLADYAGQRITLEYWVRNHNLDNGRGSSLNGVYISDDGDNFIKIEEWRTDIWTDNYGKMPPLDLTMLAERAGLSFTDQFQIRFQYADDDDFNRDGIYLDNILIREQPLIYATLPFSDGFEDSRLSPAWQMVNPSGQTSASLTTPGNTVSIFGGSEYANSGGSALAIGRRNDNSTTTAIAADVHLNLAGFNDVSFSFALKRFWDNFTSSDAIYASDNGGASFVKIYQLTNAEFQNLSYEQVTIDLDSVLIAKGLGLTSQTVIRFQQVGTDDFSGNFDSAEDGYTIDDVSVMGSVDQNAPSIISFLPRSGNVGTQVTITGQNFTPTTQIAFAGVPAEVTYLSSSTLRAIVPTLAQTGKITARDNNRQSTTTEDFTILGRDIIFFEDWETGTIRSMWDTNSSTENGLIGVFGGNAVFQGANGLAMGNNSNSSTNTVNQLTLNIPLADYAGQRITLEYWVRNHNLDNGRGSSLNGVYISDDGDNFIKIEEWRTDIWTDNYGKMPPLDLTMLAERAGLSFTDQFQIRFQYADDDDFNRDGIYLDNILIREQPLIYATLPFSDGFEDSRLSPAWQMVNPSGQTSASLTTPGNTVSIFGGSEYANSGGSALAIGRRNDNSTTTAIAADVHLNLAGFNDVSFSFALKRFWDNFTSSDAIYASDNGGASFVKIYQLTNAEFQNLSYEQVTIDLDSVLIAKGLGLTSQTVIRFQQVGTDDFSGNFDSAEDGYTIDDVSVMGSVDQNAPSIISFLPRSGNVGTQVTITGQNFTPTTQIAFAGVPAEVTYLSSSTLRAIVPTLAQTGKITARDNNRQSTTTEDFTILGRDIIFFEDWETGTIRSMWDTNSSTENGLIGVFGGNAVFQGANGLAMGNNSNSSTNTVNQLTLNIPLADYAGQRITLEYWVRNHNLDNGRGSSLNGVYISDDGDNFIKIEEWRTDIWTDNYGKMPPLDLTMLAERAGLSFTDQFQIRFQYADDDDFNRDGIYLDNILIREQPLIYATLPFSDGFEDSRLSPAWQMVNPSGQTSASLTTPGNTVSIFGGSEYANSGGSALAIGRRNDNSTTTAIAADVHLNLAGFTDVSFSFALKRFWDNFTSSDAIYASDNGGASFVKIYQLTNAEFQNLSYEQVTIDLDSVLIAKGLGLTSQTVIRFQQVGTDDFSGNFDSAEDGYTIDDVSVMGSVDQNAPSIISFLPRSGNVGTQVTITGQNFTPTTQIAFAGVPAEVTYLSSSTLRAIVPTLAQTGKITARDNNRQSTTTEDFTILGRDIIFFEDWETGTIRSMWDTNSSTENGLIGVFGGNAVFQGANGLAMGNNSNSSTNTVNQLTLNIPLADYAGQRITLEYWVRNHNLDNGRGSSLNGVYISDDGDNFIKIEEWRTDIWTDNYGKMPPLDLTMLAERAGLSFTDQFQIRFQYADDDDFNRDGIYLDNILIREQPLIYATLPFSDGFEDSRLSPAWQMVNPSGQTSASLTTPGNTVSIFGGSEYANSGGSALAIGRRNDNSTTTAIAADVHLNLAGFTDVSFSFALKRFWDNFTSSDAIYASDNGGASFVKIYQLTNAEFQNLSYEQVTIDLDSVLIANALELTSQTIIRFQQEGQDDFSGNFDSVEDGYTIDDISITGTQNPNYPSISFLDPNLGPIGTSVNIRGQNLQNTNGVTFNGVAATVLSRTPTSVQTTVPEGATTGTVTVTAPIGPATSPGVFQVTEGNDLALIDISSPSSDCDLTDSENVTVRIRNTGALVSSNPITLTMTLSSGTEVTEVISPTLDPLMEITHTFSTPVNLSAEGVYSIQVELSVLGDEVAENNLLTKAVTHFASPVATITGPERICNGDNAQLTASGGEGYRWNTGSTNSVINVSPSADANYSVTVTSADQCVAVATYQVLVTSPERPVISASNNGVLCPGETVTLTSSVGQNVRWSNDVFAPSIEVSTPGNYRVTHTEDDCEAQSVIVRVRRATERRIIVDGASDLCLGETTTLRASGGSTFSWSTGADSNTITVSPTATTNYRVTITENGCTFVDQQTITVTPLIEPGEVTNLLPEDNSTNISNRPTLSWAPAEDADRYDLYLWIEGDPEPTEPVTVFAISYRPVTLSIDQTYNWYVVPKNDCQTGSPSATQSFTTASLPDLVVTAASGPLTAISGTEIEVRWSVNNNGQLTTGDRPWKDAPYLSRDVVLSPDDVFLGAVDRGASLSPGNGYNSRQEFLVPTCLEGEYYVIVVADYSRRIPEIDNDNNSGVSQVAIPITLSPKPDLRIDTIRPIGTNGLVGEGQSYEFTYTTTNVGPGTVDRPFTERVILNSEAFDNPATRLVLSTRSYETPMGVNESVERTVQITLPTGITGEVYFYVLADFSDAVEECLFEENNRKRFGPVRIIADPRPDFIANSIIAVDAASSGERIDLNYTLTNEGIDFSGNVSVSVYLSDTPEFNTFDRIRNFSINQDFLTDMAVAGSTQVLLPDNVSGEKYLSLRVNPGNSIDEGSNFNAENTTTRLITINAPDLTVSPPRPEATTVVAGNSVVVSWEVTNNGPGQLINQVVRDVVRLRNTNVFRSLQQSLTLDVGASSTRSVTLNIPATTMPGNYQIDLRTNANFNVYEAGILGNNTSSSPPEISLTVTEPDKADLAAISLTGPNGSFLRGASVPVSYLAGNSGAVSFSGNWRDRVYLSNTSTWTPSPFTTRLLKTRPQSRQLNVDETYTESFSVELPQNIAAGTYYLHLRVDPEDAVFEETNENNGAVSGPFDIRVLPPASTVDLRLFDVISDTIRPGRTISLAYKSENIGNTTTVAGGWDDVLVLSLNNTYEPGTDRVIARWPHATNLAPGQAYAQLETFRLPDTLPEGNFRLILVTDGGLVTQDNQSSNNERVLSINNDGGTGVITPLPRPDLALAINEILDPAIAGQPLRIVYTVTNISADTSATGSWYEGARLGNNDAFTGPTIGQQRQERTLATGASYQDTLTGQIPISAEGNYFLTLRTDAGLDVIETSGANNDASIFLPVVRPLPGDLLVQQVLAPAAAQTNDTITASWTLTNIGTNPVDGMLEHIIYFSTDEQWDIEDVELGRWRGNVSLDVNSSIEQQTDLCLTDLANGEYFVIVRVDALDNIVETNNENNETASVVPISISVPELFVSQEEATTLNLEKSLYYRLEVDEDLAGQTVRISLDSETDDAINELYVRFGNVPNRTIFDESYGEAFAEDQSIIVSDLREGTYYLMAYAAVGPPQQPVTLLAEIVPFAITAINTNVGGNTGPVTAVLTGTRFASGLQVVLEDDSGVLIAATNVTVQSPERAFVTFDLLNAPFGTYDVIATSSVTMDKDTLIDGFRITTGTSPNAAPTLSCSAGPGGAPLFLDNVGADAGAESPLRLEKIHQAFARRNQLVPMTFKYVNEGNIDVVLPRLLITSLGGAPLSLDPMIFNPETLELGMEFVEEDGPPNILRPGGVATYSVYTRATSELIFRLY